MGHSVTCTYQLLINLDNDIQVVMGAMSLKDAKVKIWSEQNWRQGQILKHLRDVNFEPVLVVNAELWPQTARGRNQCNGDFITMDLRGKITHCFVDSTWSKPTDNKLVAI